MKAPRLSDACAQMDALRPRLEYKRAVLALVLLAGVVGACGSNSHKAGSGPGATSSAPTLPTPTGEPLRIGVISSDTGPTGVNQDTPTTVKRWQDYVNSHGGISGHPVEVIEENDSDNSASALQAFNDLVQNHHVVVIGDSSYVDQAFAQAADAAKIPVVSLEGAGSGFTYEQDGNFFANQNTALGGLWGIAKVSALSGGKKLGILYCVELSACAQIPKFVTANATPLDLSVVYSSSFSGSTPNYTAQCLAAKSAGADTLYLGGTNISANTRVLDDCAAQGYQPTAITAGSSLGTAISKDKNVPLVWGFTGTIPWFVKNASTAAFHQVMDSYLGSASSPIVVMDDWAGLQVIATAVQGHLSATPTSSDIYNGLYSLSGSTTGGLTPPLTFTEGKPTSVLCVFPYKIDHGVYSTPVGPQAICK